MIRCGQCGFIKSANEFTERSLKKGGKRCNPCMKIHNKEIREQGKRRLLIKQQKIKSACCETCNEIKDSCEFKQLINKKECKKCFYAKHTIAIREKTKLYNDNNDDTKMCSKCRKIYSCELFKNINDNKSLFKQCKNCRVPQNKKEISKDSRSKNNSKFVFLHKSKRLKIWCSKCDNWQYGSKLKQVKYGMHLCKDCVNKSNNVINHNTEKIKVKEFNNRYDNYKACITCYSIKESKKFIGSKKQITEKCDTCREIYTTNVKKQTHKDKKQIQKKQIDKKQIQKKQIDKKQYIEELREKYKNDPSVQVCNNKRCRKVKPVSEFVQINGYCNDCRIKRREYDRRRNERNKNNGKSKLKDKNRYERFKVFINEIQDENEDSEYLICSDRDCKDRKRPKNEFASTSTDSIRRCKACRERNKKYDKVSKANVRNDPQKWDKVLKQQRDFRINNPEKNDEYNRRRRINVNTRLMDLKAKANSRGYKFKLSDEYATELCISPCFFCDRKIDDNTINGIDRLNNKKGYTEKNSVSCCYYCNKSKGTCNYKTFAKRNYHIACRWFPDKLKTKNYKSAFYNDFSKNADNSKKKKSYNNYKYDSKRRKIEFNLSKDEYYNIINSSNECYYCKSKIEEFKYNNKLGIDRIDSTKGYFKDNVVTCCSCCNYLKIEMPIKLFINNTLKIALNFNKIIDYKMSMNKNKLKIYNEIEELKETCPDGFYVCTGERCKDRVQQLDKFKQKKNGTLTNCEDCRTKNNNKNISKEAQKRANDKYKKNMNNEQKEEFKTKQRAYALKSYYKNKDRIKERKKENILTDEKKEKQRMYALKSYHKNKDKINEKRRKNNSDSE